VCGVGLDPVFGVLAAFEHPVDHLGGVDVAPRLVAHPQQHQGGSVGPDLVEDVGLDETPGFQRQVLDVALVGVVLDAVTHLVDERLRQIGVGFEVLSGDPGTFLGVDVLVGLELCDVVKERGDASHVDVGAFLAGDMFGQVHHVEDVVEPVLRGVPGVPAHPPALVFVLDARDQILADELLHPRELLVRNA
jgi:hypothetical protein